MKRHPEAEALWFLMHHSDDPMRVSAAVTCYCDDSGSDEESKVAVVGGVIFSKRKFSPFFLGWEEMLREFRIDGIHMADFVRPHGRYCTMSKEMKIALFTSVVKVINEYKTYSVSASVPQGDYKALLSMEVYRKLLGPYALAFIGLASVNQHVARSTSYKGRIAYLVDKGSSNHHEQLEAAHTSMLEVERMRGESITGAMAGDLDDNNYALQAADVVAWTYHRKLESEEFGIDFVPLLDVLAERWVRTKGTSTHFPLDIFPENVKAFASLVKSWIKSEGRLPSWGEMLGTSLPKRKK